MTDPLKVPSSFISFMKTSPVELSYFSITLSGFEEKQIERDTFSPFFGKRGETKSDEKDEKTDGKFMFMENPVRILSERGQ